jgi:hypothetical protein
MGGLKFNESAFVEQKVSNDHAGDMPTPQQDHDQAMMTDAKMPTRASIANHDARETLFSASTQRRPDTTNYPAGAAFTQLA